MRVQDCARHNDLNDHDNHDVLLKKPLNKSVVIVVIVVVVVLTAG